MKPQLSFLLSVFCALTIIAQNKETLHLQIYGSNQEETALIDNYNTPYRYSEINELISQLDTLERKLLTDGYYDIIRKDTRKNDTIYISRINLGQRYELLKLYINDDSTLKNYIAQTNINIKDDSITIETAFAKAYLEKLATIASNNGQPFTTFKIENIKKSKENNGLSATLTLQKNDEPRFINNIVVKGYENIPKSFLKYYAGIKPNALFNEKKIAIQSRAIATLPFVSETKSPDLLFTEDSTSLYLYLERNTVNQFDGFLGFTSEDNNQLRLNGYLDLSLLNNFNFGESFSLNYKADGRDQSQLSIKTELPYILKTPIGLRANLKLFRRDSTFSTSEQSIELLYQLNQKTSFGLGYRGQQSENLSEPNEVLLQDIESFNSSQIQASLLFQTRSNNTFFPIKRQLRLKTSYGNRNSQLLDQDQVSIEGVIENIFSLDSRNSIYIRNTTQYLISDNYLTNELYRFGGILTLRGFEENSLFANLLSTLNTEYRYTFNQSLYLNTILDYGYFENDLNDVSQNLYSVGFGAGINTKAGILKINIANGKFENTPFLFSNTKLHIILAVSF